MSRCIHPSCVIKRLMKMPCMMKKCKKNVIKDNSFGKIKIAVGHRGDNKDKASKINGQGALKTRQRQEDLSGSSRSPYLRGCKDGGSSGRRKPSIMWVRVCSADNKYVCFKASTVIYSRINLYLEVAWSGMIWNNTFKTMLSIHVSNVYDRKRLWIINSSVYAYASRGKRECKCPDVRKRLEVWREYSGCRVRSPLVDLTAQHKKSALVIGPLHRTQFTVTDMWRADYYAKQTLWLNRRYIWLPVSHNKGQNNGTKSTACAWMFNKC